MTKDLKTRARATIETIPHNANAIWAWFWAHEETIRECLELVAREDVRELINPDMPGQQLRLHMGELTPDEALVARSAIRWANTRISKNGNGEKYD